MNKSKTNIIMFFGGGITITLWLFGIIYQDRICIWSGLGFLHLLVGAYSLCNINKRILLLLFDFTFLYLNTATFIYNGIIGNPIKSWAIDYIVNWDMELRANVIFFMALLLVLIGYYGCENFRFHLYGKKSKYNELQLVTNNNQYFMKASRMIFYIGALGHLLSVLEKVSFVQSNSYLSYYTSFISALPVIIYRIERVMFPAFCLFCVSMPSKRVFMKPAVIYIVTSIISIFYGQRNGLVLAVIFLLFYLLFRERYFNQGEHWFGKRMIYLCVILVPLFILIMVGYGYWRNGVSVGNNLVGVLIKEVESGSSGHLVLHEMYYHDVIPKQNYVFGGIINYFSNNILGDLIGLSKDYGYSAVERALHGRSFGASISYVVMSHSYMLGYGLGSCYLAEIMHDFSWGGLVVINLVYGIILASATQMLVRASGKHPYICAGLLMMQQAILYAPRAETLAFITDSFLSWYTILTWLAVFVLSKQFKIIGMNKEKVNLK